MSLGQGYDIQEVFESAVTIVRNLPKEGPIKPSDDLKLRLYACFKQATHGPNDTPKPRFYQIVEAYKWDAWRKLGDMSREEAMLSYIRELKQIMDTIPREETDEDDNRHFEEILGKKFYDYWFKQWRQQAQEQLTASQSSNEAASSQMAQKGNNNDTHSNSSSGGSSVSMLDDTSQAVVCDADQGGYRTPTSSDQLQSSITGQMSDQFALAILRLQHGLGEANSRLGRLEEQLRQSIEAIRSLESTQSAQTYPKHPLEGREGRQYGGARTSSSKLARFVSHFGTIHWFYLSYPIVVYFLMRLLFDRRRRRTDDYNRSLR